MISRFVVLLVIASVIMVGCTGKSPSNSGVPSSPPSPPLKEGKSEQNQGNPTQSNPTAEVPSLAEEDLAIEGVAFGQAITEVEKRLGRPSRQDTVQGVGALALFYDEMRFVVFADPVSEKVTGWEVTGPSLKTLRNIKVGDTKEAVLKAYGDKPSTRTQKQIIYSLPGKAEAQLGFSIADGKVIKFFVRWW